MFIVFILFYFIVSISSKTVEVDQTQIATFETVLDSWHVQFKFVFCVLEIGITLRQYDFTFTIVIAMILNYLVSLLTAIVWSLSQQHQLTN